MKKIIIGLFLIMVCILFSNNKEDYVIIPDKAIRFRIIANSNNIEDQRMKYQIKQEITPILTSIASDNYETTNNSIKKILPTIDKLLSSKLIDYQINYGLNYFPEKVYKGIKYSEGNYESLVITLGDGQGDNWWCVLFPPLCLIENQEDSLKDYEYTYYIKEIIKKF